MADADRRVALITGGTKGIGRASALRLARDGFHVVVNYLRSRNAADEAVKEIEAAGGSASSVRGNVGNPDHLNRMFDQVEKEFGHLDVFISNAAVGALKPTTELTPDDWQMTMDVNARAFLLGASRASKLMEGRNGRIVAMTSSGSTRYIPEYAAVGASKAAIEAVMRHLAVELAPKGIRVNAVCAGLIDTDSLKMFPSREKMLEMNRELTPAGRLGTTEDIAKVVAFLCSDDAEWICGQVIVADGGYSISH